MDVFLYTLSAQIDAFLALAGDNPFAAMVSILFLGGWLSLILWFFILYLSWGIGIHLWQHHKQHQFAHHLKWIVLRVTVPVSEQTPKAAENIFAQFAGAHSSISWKETWFDGAYQPAITVELASIEGRNNFFIRCIDKSRDLIEASIYAQYPAAEIEEVPDYTKAFGPKKFPDPEYDAWGAEFTPVQPDAYPLKTYREFEDAVSGEFKDPVAAVLEAFSRLGPGEQAWYQITMVPTDQKAARERAMPIIDKLRGNEPKVHHSFLSELVDLPLKAITGIFLGGGGKAAGEKKESVPKLMRLSPIEREVLEGVERKASKIGFESKIRFIYIAKKTVFSKARIAQAFIGAIKQTNTFHMQAIKPDLKKTGMSSAIWWFKQTRNDARKTRLMNNMRSRDTSAGLNKFMLSAEELATLWHFPILTQVKAPSLRQIEAKKSDAPYNIPFEEEL